MPTNHVTLSVKDMPEVLWGLRHEIAKMLRSHADGEPEIVARKLFEIAVLFETAVTEDEEHS